MQLQLLILCTHSYFTAIGAGRRMVNAWQSHVELRNPRSADSEIMANITLTCSFDSCQKEGASSILRIQFHKCYLVGPAIDVALSQICQLTVCILPRENADIQSTKQMQLTNRLNDQLSHSVKVCFFLFLILYIFYFFFFLDVYCEISRHQFFESTLFSLAVETNVS